MAKVIVPRNEGYTIMTNWHLRDKALSLKAKGLMSFMLSLPEDWDYSIEGLVKCSSDGRDSIRSAIAELSQQGYLTVSRCRDARGLLTDSEYTLHPHPQTGNPYMDNPMLDFPTLDNPTQINTKDNKELKSINKEDTNVSKKEHSDWLEFEEVWELYPKREGKQNAMKAYLKARKEGISKETIVAGINTYIEFIKARGIGRQYIKMGSTWFTQRCWQDEYDLSGYGKTARDYNGQYSSDKDQELIEF